ncbi:MAG: UDP-N-acetylglucosamine--N-acetylmuramyl-(pentapeptide) pyrophosphoryl-undecaprenol N-acetylglucosamine transferase, partial [Pseudomonadota bacterium]
GWLIPQEDATSDSLSGLIRSLLGSPDKLQRAAKCARRVGVRDAAERLADLVCEMIGDNAHGAAETEIDPPKEATA